MPIKNAGRPSAPEAARRLVILKHLIAKALASPPPHLLSKQFQAWTANQQQSFQQQADGDRDEFCGILEDRGLWHYLSRREIQFAQTTMLTRDKGMRIDMCWRIEAAQCLMWALRIISELPPYDTLASPDILKMFDVSEPATFIREASLRPESEIDEARSLAELWHWRSRTRQLIEMGKDLSPDAKMLAAGFRTYDDIVRFTARKSVETGTLPRHLEEDFPARNKAYRNLTRQEWQEIGSITVERHFACNWLSGYAPRNNWDETPTDT